MGHILTYIEQPSPDGLAQAYLLSEAFLEGAPSAMVLGDNVFFGADLSKMLRTACAQETGGTIFGYRVADPERYGVIAFDSDGAVRGIVEKPGVAPSPYAVTGSISLMAQRRNGRARCKDRHAESWKSRRCWKCIWPMTRSRSR